ncbi:MaoC family dehydratase N-terminal domain-containing protein [Brachybacterium paraconglomeratum]
MIEGSIIVGSADSTSGDIVTTTPDPAFAGRSYPAGPVHTVSAAKIIEFAHATGSSSPLHSDPEAARDAGHAGVVAPPTFLVSLAQATEAQYIEDPAAGIDFRRVVHGEETFTLHRPVVAGDRLVPTLTVEAVRAAGGHSMITTRVDLADESGTGVASVRSMLVVRGA